MLPPTTQIQLYLLFLLSSNAHVKWFFENTKPLKTCRYFPAPISGDGAR